MRALWEIHKDLQPIAIENKNDPEAFVNSFMDRYQAVKQKRDEALFAGDLDQAETNSDYLKLIIAALAIGKNARFNHISMTYAQAYPCLFRDIDLREMVSDVVATERDIDKRRFSPIYDMEQMINSPRITEEEKEQLLIEKEEAYQELSGQLDFYIALKTMMHTQLEQRRYKGACNTWSNLLETYKTIERLLPPGSRQFDLESNRQELKNLVQELARRMEDAPYELFRQGKEKEAMALRDERRKQRDPKLEAYLDQVEEESWLYAVLDF